MTALFSFVAALWKYAPAIVSFIEMIEAHMEEEKKREFADNFSKTWEASIETGDASALHALIDSHPNFKLRK